MMCSHLPPMEEGGHHHHHQVYLHRFLPAYESTSSPFPCAFFLSPSPQEGSSESGGHLQHDRPPLKEEVDKEHFFSGGSSSNDQYSSALRTSPAAVVEHGESSRHKTTADAGDGGGDPSDSGSGARGWMPASKMRFVKKMMGSDHKVLAPMGRPRKTVQSTLQKQQGKVGDQLIDQYYCNNSPPTVPARVCSDCNTTKTPLWRSGPRGPKSLCNACGIRQRKARRAMAAGAALAGGVIPAAVAPAAKVRKGERSSAGGDCTVPFKKRFKFTPADQPKNPKKQHFDELAMGVTMKSAFRRALPRDEKEEAAILLMALSCGLIRG